MPPNPIVVNPIIEKIEEGIQDQEVQEETEAEKAEIQEEDQDQGREIIEERIEEVPHIPP